MAKVKPSEAMQKTRAGAEVDSAVADAFAVEAEHGYDLSKARRRRVGRPSLGREGTSPRVSFRVTPELYRVAKRRPARKGAP